MFWGNQGRTTGIERQIENEFEKWGDKTICTKEKLIENKVKLWELSRLLGIQA